MYTHNYNTANRQGGQRGHYSQQQQQQPVEGYGGGAAALQPSVRRQMAPKNTVHNAAVKLAIPQSEREERINYLDEYSCKPPPLFLICISLAQLGVFIWHVIILTNQARWVTFEFGSLFGPLVLPN